MSIRIQFEHLRPYLKIEKSSNILNPDANTESETSRLYIYNFNHYRNIDILYFLLSGLLVEETYGVDPEIKQRNSFASYDRDSDSIKISSHPVSSTELFYSRKLYENFRRCYLMDIGSLGYLTNDEKISIENELEASNVFEQMNLFQ